ncbi:MAG: hypothetical protein ACOWYE_14430 [Desulfatiglandales bacterium]
MYVKTPTPLGRALRGRGVSKAGFGICKAFVFERRSQRSVIEDVIERAKSQPDTHNQT